MGKDQGAGNEMQVVKTGCGGWKESKGRGAREGEEGKMKKGEPSLRRERTRA